MLLNNKTRYPLNRSEPKGSWIILMYDFSTKEIHEVGRNAYYFVNDDLHISGWFQISVDAALPKNTLVFLEDAGYLIELSSRIQGEGLKTIVSTIDKEDNPVLMIAKFK